MNFKVGDTVTYKYKYEHEWRPQITHRNPYPWYGMIGKITSVDRSMACVRFSKPIPQDGFWICNENNNSIIVYCDELLKAGPKKFIFEM